MPHARALGPDTLDVLLDSLRSGRDPLVPPAAFAHIEARKAAAAAELSTVLPEPAPTPKQIAAERNAAALEAFKASRQELADALASMGLDVKTSSNAQLRAAIEKASKPGGLTFDQPVYHGGPHIFDRFSLDKIGTGEGAQAYGWGLYFAGKKEVAKFYRENLSREKVTYAGEWPARDDDSPKAGAIRAVARQMSSPIGQDVQTAIDTVTSQYDSAGKLDIDTAPWLREAAAATRALDPAAFKIENGRLYTVEIPDDGAYLLWDKPMSEQPAPVKAAIEKLGHTIDDMTDGSSDGPFGGKGIFAPVTGGEWYKNVVSRQMVERISEAGKAFAKGEPMGREISEWNANPFKGASLTLHEAGIPGIKYLDGVSRGDGEGSFNYVLFDDSLAEIKSYEQEARGSITFGENRSIIRLFEGRDLSTLAHESGHLWLAELEFDVKHVGAGEKAKADWQTILDFAGVKAGDPLLLTDYEFRQYSALKKKVDEKGVKSLDGAEADQWDALLVRVEQNEKLARAFETYLMEGKAPSEGLRAVFRSFKNWLIGIYRNLAKLQAPISPEMRQVFDRLIATDEEIAGARDVQGLNPVFKTAKDMESTEDVFKAYTKRTLQVVDEAEEKVLGKVMASLRKERTKEMAQEKAKIRGEVKDELMADPGQAALHFLRNGTLYAGETPDVLKGLKLTRADLVALIGEDGLLNLPRGIYADEGITPDALAQVLGLGNGTEVVERLMQIHAEQEAMRSRGDSRSVINVRIAEETQRRLFEVMGDPLNDGSIEAEAMAAVHSDKQGALMAADLKVLARKAGHSGVISLDDIKAWAAEKIGEMSSYQATQFAKYLRAERLAGQAVQKHLVKGDFVAAFKAKQDQIVNFALYQEAKKAADETAKITVYLDKLAGAKNIKALDQDYLDTIHELMEEFDFKKRSGSLLAERTLWNAYAAREKEAGVEVVEPPRLKGAQRKHYSQMTMDELRGFYDTVKQIDHLGRKKKTLLLDGKKRDLDAVLTEMEATAAAGVQRGGSLSTRGLNDIEKAVGKSKHWLRVMNAELLKMERLLEFADGDKTGRGIFTRMILRPISAAQNATNDRRVELGKKQAAIYENVPLAQRKAWAERHVLPELGVKLDKESIIAIALNMGNASNLEKMLLGEKWSEAGVRAVVNKYLTKEEWQFVDDMWKLIDSQWPETAAMVRDVEGVAPPKVEAGPLVTPFGTLDGGYYPVEYARNEGLKGDKVGEVQDSALLVGMPPSPRYGRPSSKAGSTNARTEFNAPLNLSLSVIGKHLDEVAHDIFHRRAVADIFKIVSNDRFREAMRSRLGVEYEKQFMPWLMRVASEARRNNADLKGWDWFMKAMRVNVTVMAMGLRVSTMVQQFAGYANSMQRLGGKDMLKGMAEFWPNPARAAENVYALSGEMRNRANNLERDIRANLDKYRGKKTPKANLVRFAFRGIVLADLSVSIPTWLGAYRQALEKGFNEADAIAYADKMVRDTQGGGGGKDMSAFQDGSETWKAIGMFGSYLSVFHNAMAGLVEDGRKPGKTFSEWADLFWQGTLLAVVSPMMAAMLAGQGPDEEEDPLYWAMRTAGFGAFSGIPIVRDVASTISREAGGKPSAGFKLSPIEGPIEGATRLVKDLTKLASGEDVSKNFVKNTFNVVGGFVGIPLGQPGVTAQFFLDVIEGSENPENLLEWMRGLSYGPKK